MRAEQGEKLKSEHAVRRLAEIFKVSVKLGVTSFGGPIAHLGYFHEEYVRRRKWLDERSYADLVALCQFLPGPASSQVGMGIGIMRAGYWGGLLAFLGFTLPSVIAMVLFSLFVQRFDAGNMGWIHGLKLVAVAIVAQAVWGMGRKLAPDRSRLTIAVAAAAAVLLWQTSISQVGAIVAAGVVGWLLFKNAQPSEPAPMLIPVRRSAAVVSLLLFAALFILLPLTREMSSSIWLAMFDGFYRSGSLVFGGGHVVLPLLEREVVPSGWVGEAEFLAGYGAAQAVPGPLFTFAAYLGAIMNGWLGAIVAMIAIFLPAWLLVVGTLPFWASLRKRPQFHGVLMGVNAAVVGILLAALYDPIWTSTIRGTVDFVMAAFLFVMLMAWKLPPWIVVLAGAIGGMLFG